VFGTQFWGRDPIKVPHISPVSAEFQTTLLVPEYPSAVSEAKPLTYLHRTEYTSVLYLVMWGGKFSIENFPKRKIFRNIFPENFPFLKIIT
jgi:hypothetical protein